MKKLLVISILFGAISLPGVSQNQSFTKLTPAKGYYKSLQSYSAKPKSSKEEIDTEKFPYDQAAAEKRLSLKPYYLDGVSTSDFVLPDPPANSSDQTRAELNYLLALQQQRIQLDVESSLYMAGVFYNVRITPNDSSYNQYRRNLFFVGRSIGSWFNPTNLPLTADLMAHVWQDASYFIWGFKYKYLRIRPYKIDSNIKNLEETNWAAYPSGHAANSYINAYVYQELAPAFSDTFVKDAYDMAHSREIIGVHYPSDSEASRNLARQFVNKLFQNKKFLHDFELVKREWAQKAKETFDNPGPIQQDVNKGAASCGQKTSSACATKCE